MSFFVATAFRGFEDCDTLFTREGDLDLVKYYLDMLHRNKKRKTGSAERNGGQSVNYYGF